MTKKGCNAWSCLFSTGCKTEWRALLFPMLLVFDGYHMKPQRNWYRLRGVVPSFGSLSWIHQAYLMLQWWDINSEFVLPMIG